MEIGFLANPKNSESIVLSAFVCLFVCLFVSLSVFFFSSSVREGLTFFLKTSTDRDEIFRHGPDNIDHPTLLLNFMTVAKIRLLQVDPG